MTEIRELDTAERLRLIQDIWETLTDDPEQLPISDEVRAELGRRLKDVEEHPHAESPLAEAMDRLTRDR